MTMLILAFGLLGVAGLLVGGVSNAASTESFSKASQLASDMADRIRANRDPISGDYIALSATSEYLLNDSASSASTPSAWTNAIPSSTSTTIAKNDLRAWMTALATQLPGGRGRIDSVPASRLVNITIAWSNCFGTLSDADRFSRAGDNCKDTAASTYRTFKFELRL